METRINPLNQTVPPVTLPPRTLVLSHFRSGSWILSLKLHGLPDRGVGIDYKMGG